MPDFGFVDGAYEAPSIYQDAQELINWFCEIDKNDEAKIVGQPPKRGVIALYPTPGYTLQVQLPFVGEVRCLYTVSGGQILLAVSGNVLYKIDSTFTATSVGTLLSYNNPVSISDNGISAYIVDGINRYSYTWGTGTFATIANTDGAFTGGDKVVTVDNYFVYNRPGSQQFAASTALSTATPALSFSAKDGSPDNLVTLINVNRELFLLGETSSEVWQDVGNFPFPFQRIPGANTQRGCAAKYSVARLGETFAFLSQDIRGQGMIVVANGYSFERISTHAVEQSILGQTINDAKAWSYQIEGHEFYVITFPTINLTWVYDMMTARWHKWLSMDSFSRFNQFRGNCYAIFQGLNLIGDYQNGAIYALSNSVYTENGDTIRRVRRCPHLTSDLNRQFFSQLQIQFQPGVGLSTGQGSNPQAMLKWSNDGGSTWSNEHWTTIGLIGNYKNRAIWRRLGLARDRIYEVSVSDPVKAVIISANLLAEVGDH